jgi:predicted NBD/HSP70 family sugar kinase
MMEWAIGVDGGGTHTRAAIVDATGVVPPPSTPIAHSIIIYSFLEVRP